MAFKSDLVIGALVGSGYFSDVFEGRDHIHGKVAVKVLRPYQGESQAEWHSRKDDLLKEAQRLKAAEHANVVRVLNLVRADSDDRLHLIAEFCDGGSLQKEVEKGPLTLREVREAATEVCLGLTVLHERGMLHRDLKPANILRAKNRIKVGDFGLVTDKLIKGYATYAGYLDHLAPEVHTRNLTSVQSDIWALGMTIYRLLHGQAFYITNLKSIGIRESIERGRFASRLPWLAHIPAAWRKFVRKAMHDDPKQRFQSVFQLSQSVGTLPIDPQWSCIFSPSRTTWTRHKTNRTILVVQEILSPRKHTWHAQSQGGVQNRSLGGTISPIGPSLSNAGLEKFFADQSS